MFDSENVYMSSSWHIQMSPIVLYAM